MYIGRYESPHVSAALREDSPVYDVASCITCAGTNTRRNSPPMAVIMYSSGKSLTFEITLQSLMFGAEERAKHQRSVARFLVSKAACYPRHDVERWHTSTEAG